MGGRGQQTDTARNRGRAIETDSHAASQRGSQRLRKARVRQTCISTVTGNLKKQILKDSNADKRLREGKKGSRETKKKKKSKLN